MDEPQNGALTPGVPARVLYSIKYCVGNDFILFAVATELDAPDARQGTATIEAHQVTVKKARSDETDKRCALGCKTKKYR